MADIDLRLPATPGRVVASGAKVSPGGDQGPPGTAVFVILQNYISGLTLSNGPGDLLNDITIAPGQAADSTNTAMMTLTTSLTKQLDLTWGQGTAAGGLDAGAIWTDLTYHLYLIYNPTSQVVDVVASYNTTGPITMPTGFTQYRRIGSIIRNVGAIIQFRQNGSYFIWQTVQPDVNISNLSTARQLLSLTVPKNTTPIALFRMDASHASGSAVVVCDPFEPDAAPAVTATGFTLRGLVAGCSAEFQVRTDANGQVAARANLSATTIRINTLGYIDSRGSGTQESGSPLLAQNGFRADKGGTNQTGVATGTNTKVTFTSEVYDIGGYYDATLSRWTPPAGLVHMDASVDFSAGVTANSGVFCQILKNGVAIATARIVTSATTGASQVSSDDLASGTDYYEAWTTITSGTTGTIDGVNAARTFFAGHIPGGQAGQQGPVGAQGIQGVPGIPGAGGSEWSTGDVKLTLKVVADTNWIMMNDQFIGSPASGATFADNTAYNLFALLFANVADAQCPIQTSTGSATTRAAQGSPAGAWTNNCRMQLPRTTGRALAGTGFNAGAGLSARALGFVVGAQTFTLDNSSLPSHAHTMGGSGVSMASADVSAASGPGSALNTSPAGSSFAVSIYQPTVHLNVMIRL